MERLHSLRSISSSISKALGDTVPPAAHLERCLLWLFGLFRSISQSTNTGVVFRWFLFQVVLGFCRLRESIALPFLYYVQEGCFPKLKPLSCCKDLHLLFLGFNCTSLFFKLHVELNKFGSQHVGTALDLWCGTLVSFILQEVRGRGQLSEPSGVVRCELLVLEPISWLLTNFSIFRSAKLVMRTLPLATLLTWDWPGLEHLLPTSLSSCSFTFMSSRNFADSSSSS